VTHGAAKIKLGLADSLVLGNLDARRDWGFAGDYVRAMWLMLQREVADDYVIASGESHTVRELVEIAFSHVGLDWNRHVRTDPSLLRPAEVDLLVGDPTRAKNELGWASTVDFDELIRLMVDADIQRLKNDRNVASAG
jgi:GDPmannose 4,6-dehydratase